MTSKDIAALLAEHAAEGHDFTIREVIRVLRQHEHRPQPSGAVARAAILLGIEPDCGASGCMTTTNHSGMRTNGGCRCFMDGQDGQRLKFEERRALQLALAAATRALET